MLNEELRPEKKPATDNRHRILEVAIEEFAAFGYEGASTAGIARKAGCTQPLIHYHFHSKDNLWKEVVRNAISSALAEADAYVTPAHADAGSILESYVHAFVVRRAHHAPLNRLMIFELGSGSKREAWLLEEFVVPLLRRYQKDLGSVTKGVRLIDGVPPLHIALALAGASTLFFQLGNLLSHVDGGEIDEAEIERYATTVARIFLNGILASEDSLH